MPRPDILLSVVDEETTSPSSRPASSTAPAETRGGDGPLPLDARPPPPGTPATPGAEGAVTFPPPVSDSGLCSNAAPVSSSTPLRAEPPAVTALRQNRARIERELAAKRDELAALASSEADARRTLRERRIAAAMTPSEDATRLVRETEHALSSAANARAVVVEELEALEVAAGRVHATLQAAIAGAQRDEERRVLSALAATAEKDKADLLALLDRQFLHARLRGEHTFPQALLGALYSTAISAEAMVARSSALYATVLSKEAA